MGAAPNLDIDHTIPEPSGEAPSGFFNHLDFDLRVSSVKLCEGVAKITR
jgi:hypothetical protein